jgi:NAD(P)-dependent dehydrogenase (short-subunit alcohol dehydrogenase family)
MIDLSRKKRILITGASGSIGEAIATHFRDLEWDVYGQYLNSEPNVVGITSIKKDLLLPDSGRELVEAVKPHLVINCAADQSVFSLDDPDISTRSSALMQINVLAPMEVMSAAARIGAKACINISSIEALRARSGHAIYGASKAALESLTRSAAVELSPMRVLGLRLGLISRPGIETAWPEGVTSWNQHVPLKRMGTPLEVARVIEKLASDDFGWATGTTIDFDGGANASPGW